MSPTDMILRKQCMRRIARDLSAEGSSTTLDAPELDLGQATDAQWAAFRYLADWHGVTPLLFLSYQTESRLGILPEPVRVHLKRAYDNTLSRAQWLLPHFHSLADELTRAGIEFLILKGFPLIGQLYGDLGARPSYDIDFWLPHPGDAPSAVDMLMKLGYEPIPEHAVDHREEHRHLTPLWKPQPHPQGDYYHPRLPWTVEPHLSLWEEARWGLRLGKVDGVYMRHKTERVDGQLVPVLGHADSLVYLSMHEMMHILAGNARLIHLQDLHRLCTRLSSSDWQQAWRLAEEAGLEVFLAAALWLTRSIFHTLLPPEAEEIMRERVMGGAVRRWLEASAAEEVLLQDPKAPGIRLHRLAWLSALFTKPLWQKPRAFLQPILEYAVPPAASVRQEYGLSDGQPVAPYYAVRILQGAVGYARRSWQRLRKQL